MRYAMLAVCSLLFVVAVSFLGFQGCQDPAQVDVPVTPPPPAAIPGDTATPPTAETAATPNPNQKTNEELVAEWKVLSSVKKREELNIQRASEIAQVLAERDPKGLNPLIDILESPDSSDLAKVLVTISLTPISNKDALLDVGSRIIMLTKPGLNTTTRACATQLMWHYTGKMFDDTLKVLSTDNEPRVKFTALVVRAGRNEEDALNHLMTLLDNAETTMDEKNQIYISATTQKPTPERLTKIANGLGDTKLDPDVRLQICSFLANYGDATVLDVLKASAEKDADPTVKLNSKKAMEAIQARLNSPTPPPPAATPPADEKK